MTATAQPLPLRTGPFHRRLAGQLGWYGAADIIGRVARLAATVLVARSLGVAELGTAAIAITLFELIRVLVNAGLGQAVIRAEDGRLPATCNTAARLAWLLCLGVALLQAGIGLGMAGLGLGGGAGWMLASLAGVYLVMAPGLVPVYLILRAGRVRVTAGIACTQAVTENLLCVALVLAGAGAWGLVLPKLLVAPIWLIGVRRAQPWRRDPAAGSVPAAELLRFALPVLGSEALATARLNLDNLLVGAILGVEALGLYFFVFNAGIGLSLSLTGALASTVYPHFAALRADRAALRRALDQALRGVVAAVAGLILLQALAAPLYVPLVFGARWAEAAPLVALFCLAAVTRPFAEAAVQALRAAGEPGRELRWSVPGTAAYLGGFALALPFGLLPGIATLVVLGTALQLATTFAARRALAREIAA